MDGLVVTFSPYQAVAKVTVRTAFDTRPFAVTYVDIRDVAAVIKAIEHHSILALVANDTLQVDVAHKRIMTALGNLLGVIVEVDAEHSLTATTYIDIAYEDILDHTTASRRCLDADHTVEVRRIHLTVAHPEVAIAAGNLRAYYYAAMAIFHLAVLHDHILARNAHVTAILIAT